MTDHADKTNSSGKSDPSSRRKLLLSKLHDRIESQLFNNPGASDNVLFDDNLKRRKIFGHLFSIVAGFSAFFGVLIVGILLYRVLADGWPWLSMDFLSNFASRRASQAGIKSALVGSVIIIVLTAAMSITLGVGAAIYLEEFAPKNRLNRLLETLIANLAGVPSLVYGILGLAVFVRFFHFDRSLLAASGTLSIMILPMIIITSREALRTVPVSMRMAAYALGARPWQTIRSHVLPSAIPNIMTGVILALSRALGEAAPLIIVGGVTFIAYLPTSVFDSFTTMPIQIYNWAGRPQPEFQGLAAAASIVLLGLVMTTNFVAIYLRQKFEKRSQW
jgi:phosphate transport system permease protein